MLAETQLAYAAANQRFLTLALAELRAGLREGINTGLQEQAKAGLQSSESDAYAATMTAPPALHQLTTLFGLSVFERLLLLACAGVELDRDFAATVADLAGEGKPQFTFSLALAWLPGAHWSALSPQAPLRYWQLIETAAQDTLVYAPLRISERALHFLTAVPCVDERLDALLLPVQAGSALPASQLAIAQEATGALTQGRQEGQLPVLQLCGSDGAPLEQIAAAAAGAFGVGLYAFDASALPQSAAETGRLRRLWEREAILSTAGLVLEARDAERPELVRVVNFLEGLRGVCVLLSRDGAHFRQRRSIRWNVEKPTRAEQSLVWARAMGPLTAELNGQLGAVTSHFHFHTHAIESAALRVGEANTQTAEQRLWTACVAQAGPKLSDLAERLSPREGFEQLVLPQTLKRTLAEVLMQVRQQPTVYDSWGFGAQGARGLGLAVLFAGPSGTGKTMAAEVMAGALRMDVYRVDLSATVSKYIGETEKNLRRIFDAAEDGGVVLLFDEADALFGKRSEVQDSHDRYANIEVSYLLQRMESFRGLSILTTNQKSAMDTAFMRRLRFIVDFPFPDAADRSAIWQRVFPEGVPRADLDPAKLGRLNLSGGHIRNIALGAAFRAAEAKEPVSMDHLAQAARSEYGKMGRPLPERDVEDWR